MNKTVKTESMKSEKIAIIDNRTGRRTDALLIEDPDDTYVEAIDKLWWIYRQRFFTALKDTLKPKPEHHHWNWQWKFRQALARNTFFKCFGIICDGDPQGLLMLNYGQEYRARLPEQQGQPLVYLAYIESAPWNVRGYSNTPSYGGVGTLLCKAAIEFSVRLGYDGRAALHSLPSVEGFYARHCGMLACGPDEKHKGLVYFESTPEISSAFLTKAEE